MVITSDGRNTIRVPDATCGRRALSAAVVIYGLIVTRNMLAGINRARSWGALAILAIVAAGASA